MASAIKCFLYYQSVWCSQPCPVLTACVSP